MDFKKFRSSGELSDIRIVVDGEAFQLHRFPLYTKSDYFLKQLASVGDGNEITLENFPGGYKTFSMVADFAYNIKVVLTEENVFAMRCAAKYLEMYGENNLYDKTDVFIESCIMDAKRGKCITGLLLILSATAKYDGDLAQETFNKCVEALAYHWNKCQYGVSGINEVCSLAVQDIFYAMPFDFFIKVMQACKEKLQNEEILDVLVSEYIYHILMSKDNSKQVNGEIEVISDDGNPSQNKDSSEAENTSEVQVNREAGGMQSEQNNSIEFTDENLKMIKDLIDGVKPHLTIDRHRSAKWLRPLLAAYAKVDGSDEVLGSIAASMVNLMDQECVSTMSEETLLHFGERVEKASLCERTRLTLVNHLLKQSEIGSLSADGFIKLCKLLMLNEISCHDGLLQLINNLTKTETGLTESQMQECLELVSVKKCTVKGLRCVSQSAGLPQGLIASAALDLCDTLQERLDATSRLIQEQEKEISSLSVHTFGMDAADIFTPRPYSSASSYSNKPHSKRNSLTGSSHRSTFRTSQRNESVLSPRSVTSAKTSSPTASLGRVMDTIWLDRPDTPPGLYDSHPKLTDYLKKQRSPRVK